jgi:arylformamidase
MTLQDISTPLREGFPVWPGHAPLAIERIRGFEMGDYAQVSNLAIGCHTGTHLDAPRHFVPGGGLVDKIDLRRLIGPCHVVHYTGSGPIRATFFQGLNLPDPCRRVLLKCDHNAGKLEEPAFFEDYAGITQDAAQFLVDRGMVCIGTDYLSIGPYHSGNVETHQTLLGAEVVIVEGLDFRMVAPGEYTLLCMPPAVPTDGMPCRAALLPAGTLPELWS